MTPGWFDDVLEFHGRVGAPVAAGFTDAVLMRRLAFITEEFGEVERAINDARRDAGENARRHLALELIDLTWVVLGTFAELGVDPTPVWDAVRVANMAKQPAPDGGKAIKGPGWQPPAVALRPIGAAAEGGPR